MIKQIETFQWKRFVEAYEDIFSTYAVRRGMGWMARINQHPINPNQHKNLGRARCTLRVGAELGWEMAWEVVQNDELV